MNAHDSTLMQAIVSPVVAKLFEALQSANQVILSVTF